MRKPAVAGQFYPETKEELKKEVENLLSCLSESRKNIKAGISPHAGYKFSGKCASSLFSLIKKDNIDTFIILGTNHSGLGENICFSIDDFDTPLGAVENNLELLEEILIGLKKEGINAGVNELAHKYEHSIEVQLPFIKYISRARIVPILIQNLALKEIEKTAAIFSKITLEREKQGKRIFILVSSDFTHYGKSYNFLPFTENIKDGLYKLDGEAIESILKLDLEKFYSISRKSTICGRNAISLLIEIAKNLKLKGEKICYCTSGDITGKWDNVVGYASIIFQQNL